MKNRKTIKSIITIVILIVLSTNVKAWQLYTMPRVVAGGSIGYFRISLHDFSNYYDSRWGGLKTGQISVRAYRNNYLTVQYSTFEKDGTAQVESIEHETKWKEEFLHVGIRRYSDMNNRWRFYTGFGFTFIDIEETPGFSLLNTESETKTSNSGSGFFLELGADYYLIPNLAVCLEFEATTASEGGSPGFVGSNMGGYLFQVGLNIHL